MESAKELMFTGLTADNAVENVDIIKNLIVNHDRSSMLEAKQYYENKGENNFLKKLIRQKINYLLGKPITVKNGGEIDWSFLKELARKASIEGVSWLHVFVDTKGAFRTRVIDGHEIIPIYDTDFNTDIVEIIRYYQIAVVTNTVKSIRTRVELWDNEKVVYYIEDDEGNYILDIGIPNPIWHFTKSYSVLNKIFKTDLVGWGAPPFIPLYNNDEQQSDWADIEKLVKAYNKTMSGFTEAIDDLKDSLLLIKDKSYTDYLELKEMIEKYRMLPVDDTGDAKYISPEVIEGAREKALAILKDNIYDFGMGIDTRKIADGGNLTNVAIRARLSDLDLKADEFSGEIYKFSELLMNFYIAYKQKSKIVSFKKYNLEITFNKNVIINTTELLDSIVKQKGIISDYTLLVNHPWVTDPKKELEMIDNETLGLIRDIPKGSG